MRFNQPLNDDGVPMLFSGSVPKASVELDYGVVRLVLEDGGKAAGWTRRPPLPADSAPLLPPPPPPLACLGALGSPR